MKHIFLLLIPFVFFGCQSPKELPLEKQAEQAMLKAGMSPVVERDFFMDFQLGMTETEFNEHLNKLLEEGKVYPKEGKACCDITAEYNSYTLTFVPSFFEDKLYKLTLPFEKHPSEQRLSIKYDAFDIYQLFKKKREDFDCYIIDNSFNDEIRNIQCFKDNLLVLFENNHDFIMYLDVPTEKKKEALEKSIEEAEKEKNKQEQKKKSEESSSNF